MTLKAGTHTDIDLARICGIDEMTNPEERIEKIVFNDFSKFDINRCSDGGNYWFKTVWARTDVDQWAVSYDTSCTAFAYCEACGNFYQGSRCGCGGNHTILTTAELAEELKKYKECETENDWFTVRTDLTP